MSTSGRSRHAVVAVFMQAMVTVVYSWSVFRVPLAALHGWSKAQTILPYRYALLAVAAGAVVGGLWQDRQGSRRVAVAGGVLMIAGCILSALFGGSIAGLVVSYGVMTGFGGGLVYVTPIANIVKWFPDRRGTMVGLAVMGSGLSSLLWSPLIERSIGSDAARFAETIPRTFWLMGAIFIVAVGVAARFYAVPPPGWKPAGWNPPPAAARRAMPSGEVLKTWQFYALWTIFFLSASVGLTAIGQAAPLVHEVARESAPLSAGVVVGLVGILNGIGRLAWGAVSDRTGRRVALLAMSAVSAFGCVVFLRQASGFWDVVTGLGLVAFSYGGCLAVMPSLTADFFGASSIGGNYGLVFSAWGICGFLAPAHFEKLLDSARQAGGIAEGYNQEYWTLAALGIAAALLAIALRSPRAGLTGLDQRG